MADISAKDVAALRKITGAGMMDCKKALEETGGDLEAAKDWLRERNLAGAAKRAGRSAEQGTVDVVVEGGVGALVELTCETDFVAKNADFKAMVTTLATQLARNGDTELGAQSLDGSTVADTVQEMSGKLGEKIELGRTARFEAPGGLVDGYKHVQNERGVIGVLVEVDGVDAADEKAREAAHDIALHIANSAPRYVRRDDVPESEIAHEREILEAQTRQEGKPEQAIAKIVEGKLNGYFKQVCLLEQPFVRDPKVTVGSLLDGVGAGATVKRFVRVKVGED